MSATVKKDEMLKEAVANAIRDGILVLGSAAGEGFVTHEAWPADFPSVASIAASTLTGKETAGSVKEYADYLFPGKKILVETFVGSEPRTDEVSGTSFATAIAAGVASLILSCRRLALSTQSWKDSDQMWAQHLKFRRDFVLERFRQASKNHGKYVNAWTIFCPDTSQPRWDGVDEILQWIKTRFGS